MSPLIHSSVLVHLALVYSSEISSWEPESRKSAVKVVNEIFRKFLGSAGYLKVRDFYYSVMYWVLENSQEKDLVLAPIFSFLLGSLLVSTDLIGNEYRFYRFIDIANKSTELTRAAFSSVEEILIKTTKENLNLFLNISDMNEIVQTNNMVLLKQQNLKKREKIINRALSVADGELDRNLFANLIDEGEGETLIPLGKNHGSTKHEIFERKVSSVHSDHFISNKFTERSSGGDRAIRARAKPLSLNVLSSKIRLTHKPMKSLMGFNSDLLVLSKVPFNLPNITERNGNSQSSMDASVQDLDQSNSRNRDDRMKFLTLWRYLYSLVDFDKFTTATLKDARVYEIFNRWIMLTSQILAIATSFGSDYQDVTSSKYTRVGFHMIQDMFMDKLNQVFCCLFASDGLQKTNDKDTTQRLLTVRARIIEVFILMILRVECVPNEVLEMVIRELNRDPGIIHGIVEENSSFETSMFIMEYRNHLKATALLVPNIYAARLKFIYLYFPPLMYSLMGERNLSKTGLFCTVFHQMLNCVVDKPILSRSKIGPICTTMMCIYLEYKMICEQFSEMTFTDKVVFLKREIGSNGICTNDLKRQTFMFKCSSPADNNSPTLNVVRGDSNEGAYEADHVDAASQKVTKTDAQESEEAEEEFAKFHANLEVPGTEIQGHNRRSTTPISRPAITEWESPKNLLQVSPIKLKGSLSDKKNSSNEEILSSGSLMNCLNDEYITESEFDDIINNMEEIVNFGNDVLLFTGSEIKRTAGLQLTPFYIIMKFHYMITEPVVSDLHNGLGHKHQTLLEGFLRSVRDKPELVRQSFKTGEILVYLFFMLHGCKLENQTGTLFVEVLSQLRNSYMSSDQSPKSSKIIDKLIAELWLSQNIRDFSIDRSKLQKKIEVQSFGSHEQSLVIKYEGFLDSKVRLTKLATDQAAVTPTEHEVVLCSAEDIDTTATTQQNQENQEVYSEDQDFPSDFSVLFTRQSELEAIHNKSTSASKGTSHRHRDVLVQDTKAFKQRVECKLFESACRQQVAKLNFLQNRAVSTVLEPSTFDQVSGIKTVAVPALFIDQFNCVADPKFLPEEFAVNLDSHPDNCEQADEQSGVFVPDASSLGGPHF